MNERLVANRYRLDQRLDSGGMGDVWGAHDIGLDRPVALKFLALDRNRQPQHGGRSTVQMVNRFRREAQATARVNSRHVVTVHDQGEENDQYYLVMEKIEGSPLSTYMGAGNTLTLEQTVRWGTQICEGLADAHEAEVIHRDVKPDNIMITERGDVKLVDFGLALLLDATVTHGTGLTWLYASPERINNEPGNERSDLYSFGCVLYEMLTGRPPFGDRETSTIAIANMHVQSLPSPPQNVRPGVPAELNDLTLCLLQKDPARRPRDASTVSRLIQQVRHAAPPSGGAVMLAETPHVNPDYVEQIRELERSIRTMQFTHGFSAPEVIGARMKLADLTGESGDRHGAVSLYERLGRDCQRAFGPYDTRTLDAFEAMAQWIAADH